MQVIFLLIFYIVFGAAQWDPNFAPGRTVIVHLFEWRWNDIAEECERFLGPYGYGGVQTSPASENAYQINPFRPWSERYTPVSYRILTTRSGTEEEFASMVRRCNSVGVRIYVDAVINHLSGPAGTGRGTGGSEYDWEKRDFPEFSAADFNDNRCRSDSGLIDDWNDPNQYRNCRLDGLPDLNQETDWVRDQLSQYLNKLISYGVAGFRIDATKHMWPDSLKNIFDSLTNLNTEHGFGEGARPFIYQEVYDYEDDADKVIGRQYYQTGRITEFKHSLWIGEMFRGYNQLKWLRNWGNGWGMHDEDKALVFVDNHDNQRGGSGPMILTFREPRLYKMAIVFMLAHPFGVARVMSSYYWEQRWEDGRDVNNWIGPPHTPEGDTLPVIINPDLTCGNDWICEHRWRQIFNMVTFRNVVEETEITNWWDNDNNQIAFCRGDKGFIAINNDGYPMSGTFHTCLPPGQYCDVISGSKYNGTCSGLTITVGANGNVDLFIDNEAEYPVVGIHIGAKLDEIIY